MKIFFLGGSFDPPHIAHLKIAKSCLKYCDKFLFIPSKQVPHKQGSPYFSNKDRVKMLEILIAGYKGIEIDFFELQSKNNINYSIKTIEYLNAKYQKADIYMVIGSDLIENLYSWKDWPKIKKSVKLVCIKRAGYVIEFKLKNVKYISDVDLDISSSYVKKLIFSKNKKNKLKISQYITKNVSEYIFENLKMNLC